MDFALPIPAGTQVLGGNDMSAGARGVVSGRRDAEPWDVDFDGASNVTSLPCPLISPRSISAPSVSDPSNYGRRVCYTAGLQVIDAVNLSQL